ncbi:hypothetical protein SAMN04488527_11922 [Aliiroseovarius crassostreae]|nr:hypothetical protein [Aliiroseovarius crassostreae]SFU82121.1 hypothetical protein SAMN04488527_11922 [Aliiroseovarius crassostreae]
MALYRLVISFVAGSQNARDVAAKVAPGVRVEIFDTVFRRNILNRAS